MSDISVTRAIPHTDAEYEAAIDAMFAEMARSEIRMEKTQERIERLKAESKAIRAETEIIKARTQERLDALARMV